MTVQLSDLLVSADAQAWTLAALVTVLRDNDAERSSAARRVLTSTGLSDLVDLPSAAAVAAQAESSLRQATAAASGSLTSWADLPDEVVVLQGESSAQAAPAFAQFVLPALEGLADRLASPGATMLDVGTGIGALAAAYAQAFPTLTVTGIDLSPRVLDLGAQRLAAQQVERVVLRCQSVTDLDEQAAYDLVWVPAPFLNEQALRAGLIRCLGGLKPGGWLLLGHSKGSGDPLQEALNAFKTLTYGGTVLLEPAAVALLMDLGYTQARGLPTPPGAPGLTAARRPEA